MMSRSFAFEIHLFLFLVFLPMAVIALGVTEEEGYEPVSGMENWTHSIPLEELEPGKYNLLLRARDNAGNERLSEPVNIRFDPASDIPVVSISTPDDGSVVGRRFVVLGTASDDDGVERIEIVLDDNPPITAEGTDFWSLSVDFSDYSEGLHTLTVSSVDIHGTESTPITREIYLDSGGPDIEITGPELGEILGGRFVLDATIRDANGLATVELRYPGEDGEEVLKRSRVRRRKTEVEFSQRIDTRDLPDGPLVLWLSAEDRNGNRGEQPVLYFVDNDPPEIRVDTVIPEMGIPGDLTLSGAVFDALSVESLTAEIDGGEPVEIELQQGNPYWSYRVPVDVERKQQTIRLTARDSAGNSTHVELKVSLDEAADLPRLEIYDTPGLFLIAGSAVDDDGIEAVEYRLKGDDEWNEVASTGSFVISPAFPPGSYTFFVRGRDTNGRPGEETEVVISVPVPAPLLSLPLLLRESGESVQEDPLVHALVLHSGESAAVAGDLLATVRPNLLRYSLDEGEWKALRLQEDPEMEEGWNYRFPLNSRETPGRHDLVIEIVSEDGTVLDRFSTWYYRLETVPEEPDPERVYVTEIPDPMELVLLDGRMEEPLGSAEYLYLRNGRPLVATIPGGEVAEAYLVDEREATESEATDEVAPTAGPEATVATAPVTASVASDLFDIEILGSAVTVAARQMPEGAATVGEATLHVVTTEGDDLTVGPFYISSDIVSPALTVESPEGDSWHSELPEIHVTAYDETSLVETEYSINGGDFTTFSGVLLLPESTPDGVVGVRVRARDEVGNETEEYLTFHLDKTAPAIERVTPLSTETVNGLVSIVAAVEDASPLDNARWYPDGVESEVVLDPGAVLTFSLDLAADRLSEDPPTLKLTDRAGNEAEIAVELVVDRSEDTPEITIQLPQDGSVHREDFFVSGTVIDDDGQSEVFYRTDDGEPLSAGTGNSFKIPVAVADLGDNEHVISVRARDIGGTESEEVSVSVSISLDSPRATVVAPALDSVERLTTVIQGTAEDVNGIETVEVSIDNGASFQQAIPSDDPETGWNAWSYPLDTAVLRDGLYAVQYRAVDVLGTTALFSHLLQVDNTPPEILLDLPAERTEVRDTIPLSGRVKGVSGEVLTLEYRLSGGEWITLDVPESGIFNIEVPLKEAEPGSRSLEIRSTDRAGNIVSVSRTILVLPPDEGSARLTVLSPLSGERSPAGVTVSGLVTPFEEYNGVTIVLQDGKEFDVPLNEQGFFSQFLDRDRLSVGSHDISIFARSSTGSPELTETRHIEITETGTWITVTSHSSGQLVGARPEIAGIAGYIGGDEEMEIDRIFVSTDNGRSFVPADGKEEWTFRIETQDLPDGTIPVLLRARANNGESSIHRFVLSLDTESPSLEIETPRDNEAFDREVRAGGTAADNTGLASVEMILREGDKNRYEVPEFIQGLYLDGHALGATFWDVGLGLTFFDDNVKLQGQIGYAPAGRFSGLVLGGKLLANIINVPFSYLLGPNWGFLSAAAAVGANFSYFSMSESNSSEQGLVLGGVVGQLEFPIISTRFRMFNTFSFYTELQFWFISSDVEGGTLPKISFGLRTQLL